MIEDDRGGLGGLGGLGRFFQGPGKKRSGGMGGDARRGPKGRKILLILLIPLLPRALFQRERGGRRIRSVVPIKRAVEKKGN